MAKKIPAEAGRLQLIYEAALKWFAFATAAFHLSLSILFYFFEPLTRTLRNVEKWAVLILAIAVFVYLLLTKLRYPRLMPRITGFAKQLFRPELTLLLVFFLWLFICTVSANDRYTANFFQINDMHLFNMFVDVFILFPMAHYMAKAQARHIAELFLHALMAVMTGAMVFILWRMLQPSVIFLPDGAQIGMTSGHRLCINCNPNTTGAYAEVILLVCLCMAIRKKGAVRWLYAVASAVHFIVMVLSNSRACFGATALAIAFLAAKAMYHAFSEKKLLLRIFFSLAAAACTAGLLILLRNLIFIEYENISHFSSYLSQSSSGSASSAVDAGARALDLDSSGRTAIWKASIKSVFTDIRHILFGVTPAGVISEINIIIGKQMYTHNEFLEVAVSMGLPGLAIYCVWLFRQAKHCINDTLKEKKGYLSAILLMLVSSNMMEATLMFYWFLPESAFFLAAGAITYGQRASSDISLR